MEESASNQATVTARGGSVVYGKVSHFEAKFNSWDTTDPEFQLSTVLSFAGLIPCYIAEYISRLLNPYRAFVWFARKKSAQMHI